MPMCGLGVPVSCRMKHANLRVWSVWGFFGLANGRLGRPEEAMDAWPWGACWLQDEAQGIV